MFDKGKQLLQMRNQAKKLQKELGDVTESVQIGNVKVKVSADQKVLFIEKDGDELGDVMVALNKAFKQVQKKAAKRMMEMGGGLEGLLGGLK